MDPGINRAEQLYLAWEQRQKELESTMGASLDARKMQALKYQFLSLGLFRVSVEASEKERLYIQVLRAVVLKLAKMLYPNPVLRFLIGVKGFVLDKPLHLRHFKRLKEENIDSLKAELSSLGMGSISVKLEDLLDYERQSAGLELVRGLNTGEKISLQVSLEKVGLGSYAFTGFNARILQVDGDEKFCFFSKESGIDLREAINLLRGGSVLKNYQGLNGKWEKNWVKINDTDKNFSSSPLLHFSDQSGHYNLKKQLLDYAIALECYAISSDLVLRGLEQGNMMEISVPGKNKFYIRAGPFENRLEFFDSAKKEIGFDALKEMLVPVKAEASLALGLIQALDKEKEPQLQLNR